jgi:hypothetical protein
MGASMICVVGGGHTYVEAIYAGPGSESSINGPRKRTGHSAALQAFTNLAAWRTAARASVITDSYSLNTEPFSRAPVTQHSARCCLSKQTTSAFPLVDKARHRSLDVKVTRPATSDWRLTLAARSGSRRKLV